VSKAGLMLARGTTYRERMLARGTACRERRRRVV